MIIANREIALQLTASTVCPETLEDVSRQDGVDIDGAKETIYNYMIGNDIQWTADVEYVEGPLKPEEQAL